MSGAAAVTMIPSHGPSSGSAEAPVADPDIDAIAEAESDQPFPGGRREVLVPLDGRDRGAKLGEDRRLVAGSRADLEDPVAGRGASSSVIRATMKGWLIVCPASIGSASSS